MKRKSTIHRNKSILLCIAAIVFFVAAANASAANYLKITTSGLYSGAPANVWIQFQIIDTVPAVSLAKFHSYGQETIIVPRYYSYQNYGSWYNNAQNYSNNWTDFYITDVPDKLIYTDIASGVTQDIVVNGATVRIDGASITMFPDGLYVAPVGDSYWHYDAGTGYNYQNSQVFICAMVENTPTITHATTHKSVDRGAIGNKGKIRLTDYYDYSSTAYNPTRVDYTNVDWVNMSVTGKIGI